MPTRIAQEWVASDAVLPLLDGLDEVKAEHRLACVNAINAFRQSHGLLPLVVTCRTADYEAIADQLRLYGAIRVQPLRHEQVNSYLTALGSAGEPVRSAIQEDPGLWDLLDSPLMLNLIAAAHAGEKQAAHAVASTLAERRDQLFRLYVNKMLDRRAGRHAYQSEQTVHWLSWLAREMADHGQQVFALERLQLSWLPEPQRVAAQISNVLASALLVGLLYVLIGGLLAGSQGSDLRRGRQLGHRDVRCKASRPGDYLHRNGPLVMVTNPRGEPPRFVARHAHGARRWFFVHAPGRSGFRRAHAAPRRAVHRALRRPGCRVVFR